MKPPWMLLLAATELLGGIFVIAGYALIQVMQPNYLAFWQIAMAVGFGVFATSAGVALLRSHRWGVPLSLALQALQLVAISSTSHFRFVSLAGIKVRLVVASNGGALLFGGGGEFLAIPFNPNGSIKGLGNELEVGLYFGDKPLEAAALTVGINLAAAFFAWRLFVYRKPIVVPAAELANALNGRGDR